jgi:hypothetical protein
VSKQSEFERNRQEIHCIGSDVMFSLHKEHKININWDSRPSFSNTEAVVCQYADRCRDCHVPGFCCQSCALSLPGISGL